MIKLNIQNLIDACPDPACDVDITMKTSEVWIDWSWSIPNHGNYSFRRVISLREVELANCDILDLELDLCAKQMNEAHQGFSTGQTTTT